MNRLRKRNGITDRMNPHKFRHTYATVNVNNGANIADVRRALGHADISTTMNIYVHPDEYAAKRGVYIDVRSELDCMHIDTEEKLLDALNNLDTDYRIKVSDNFCHKYLQAFGNASVQSCDLIYQNLQKK